MKFTLEINCDNAAFCDGLLGLELSRILGNAARMVEDLNEHHVGDEWGLRDTNGNTVGRCKLAHTRRKAR